jgi:hypothetical protein
MIGARGCRNGVPPGDRCTVADVDLSGVKLTGTRVNDLRAGEPFLLLSATLRNDFLPDNSSLIDTENPGRLGGGARTTGADGGGGGGGGALPRAAEERAGEAGKNGAGT